MKKTLQCSIEQQRAAFALERITDVQSQSDKWQERYSSYVKSLPATILMCGLGQAAATLLAKAESNKDSPHYRLYEDLGKWLCREKGILTGQSELIKAITNADMETYLHAQAETLAFLTWLKKFAVAFLKQPKAGEGN